MIDMLDARDKTNKIVEVDKTRGTNKTRKANKTGETTHTGSCPYTQTCHYIRYVPNALPNTKNVVEADKTQ